DHGLVGADQRFYLGHRGRSDRAALDQPDQREQLVGLDRRAVLRTNLDIDADHAAAIHQLAQAGIEYQRAAVCDSGLDDLVRPQRVDDLLNSEHVLGQLDDRTAQPGERVDVLVVPAGSQPQPADDGEGLRRSNAVFPTAVTVRDDDLVSLEGDHDSPRGG